MNIQETYELLTIVQVIDNRRVDDVVALAWFEVLDDVDFAAAREAVRLHRRESTEYLVPAHVRQNVERIMHAQNNPIDQWGNELEPDRAALAARDRLRPDGELQR